MLLQDFPGVAVVENLPAGDMGLIPGPGRFPMLWDSKPMCHNYRARALEPEIRSY